ncbi:MAG: CRTAC1 family protein [Planctomycetota bacterium]|nr:CRTAC1 family protein [Planctomycetota bacterium]
MTNDDSNLAILLNGPQGLRNATSDLGLGGITSRAVNVADFDRDGHPDLVFNSADGIRGYRNQGPPNYTFQELNGGWRVPNDNPEGALALDFDGDGLPDYLHAGQDIFVLRNGGERNGPVDVSDALGVGRNGFGKGNGSYILALDFNNDAFTDFVYFLGNRGVVAQNQAGKRFEQVNNGLWVDEGAQERYQLKPGLASGDLNNDGWVDVVAPGPSGLKVFLNAQGRFTEAQNALGDLNRLGGNSTRAAALADFDLDGDLDLLVYVLRDGMRAFVNQDGKGRFVDITDSLDPNFKSQNRVSYIATPDLNGDGAPDVVLWRGDSSTMWVTERQASPGAQPLRVRFHTAGAPAPLGARVEVVDAWQRTQTQWVSGGDGRGGQASSQLVFGVPPGKTRITVTYPGGAKQQDAVVVERAGSIATVTAQGIRSGAAPAAAQPNPPQPAPPPPPSRPPSPAPGPT